MEIQLTKWSSLWGAPTPIENHAQHAVRTVLRSLAKLEALNETWAERGQPILRTRFGLNTGDVVVGNVGAPERLDYTVLGDAVNLASRLESINRAYGTYALATRAVVDAAGSGFVWRHIDRVAVKGKSEPVDIYEPLGETGTVSETRLGITNAYERALNLYFEGRFPEAAASLDGLVSDTLNDPPLIRLIKLLEIYSKEPPDDWQGYTPFTE